VTDKELCAEIQKCGETTQYSITYPETIHILRLIRQHDRGEDDGLGECKSI